MKVYGLFGKNIDYSLSPRIHNANFTALGIDAKYELYSTDELDGYQDEFIKLSGFNITIPFKEEMVKYCDYIDQEAKEVGVVNCVKVDNNKLYGYNTDVYGFYKLLEKNNLHKMKSNTLIIGAGGGGRAIFYCLKKYTNHAVSLTNRTKEKALSITDQVIEFNEVSHILKEFDIVVNCTNVGVSSYVSPIDIKEIKNNAFYIDINYQRKNKFLDSASRLNAKTINGLDMLIYQAQKSFEIWFNQEACLEAMYQSIREE